MKALLIAASALVVTAAGARAAEEYPTPIARPIVSSVPVLDVSGGGAWSTHTVVTGSGGQLAADTGSQAMPSFRPVAPRPVLVQHAIPATHG